MTVRNDMLASGGAETDGATCPGAHVGSTIAAAWKDANVAFSFLQLK
jgi:hypothetical protein